MHPRMMFDNSVASPKVDRAGARIGRGAGALAMGIALVISVLGCRPTIENRDPVGETFPSVRGESLDGDSVRIPDDFAGEPMVLLVGYVQKAQFDLDRWALGILQAGLPVRVLEVPTIRGLLPGAFARTIDAGMLSGIPSEDWGSVITVYGDAGKIVRATGNEGARNGRILLLDAAGRVAWYHDRGYSAGKMLELRRAAESLVDG